MPGFKYDSTDPARGRGAAMAWRGRIIALVMVCVPGWALGAAFTAGPAHASQCANGSTCTPPDLFTGETGTLLASLSAPVSVTGHFSATVRSAVYREASNTFCSTCLNFDLQIVNNGGSTDSIALATVFSFPGTLADIGYNLTGSTAPGGFFVDGTTNPASVARSSSGSDISWIFTSAIAPGSTSVMLEIQTNATSFAAGTVSIHDGASTTAAGFEPENNHGSSSSSVVYNGQIHVFEHSSSNDRLEHNWWDGTSWHSEYLDGPGTGTANGRTAHTTGAHNSAFVYNGQLHDLYYDYGSGNLRHAWWDGTTWRFEFLDGPSAGSGNGRTSNMVGRFSSAVVYNGQIHEFYGYGPTSTGKLRHAWWDGSTWKFETLDGALADTGFWNSAVVYNGQLQDFYLDSPTAPAHNYLRHAWWNGSQWNFEYLDGGVASTPGHTSDDVGEWNSSIIYNGQLHDFYWDMTGGQLRHAWWSGKGWTTEELDGHVADGAGATADNVGQVTATTIYNGQLQVFYDDTTSGSLRHAWYAAGWTRETLDGPGSGYPGHNTNHIGRTGPGVSEDRTATLIYSGQIHVFAVNAGPSGTGPTTLEHDWWNGSSWGFEQL